MAGRRPPGQPYGFDLSSIRLGPALQREADEAPTSRGTASGPRLRDLVGGPNDDAYAVAEERIRETREFGSLMDPELKWQWKENVSEEEALFTCRLMLHELNTLGRWKGGSWKPRGIDWRKQAQDYLDRVRTGLDPSAELSKGGEPPALTSTWSKAYYRVEIELQEPVRGTFHEGRGSRRRISSRRSVFRPKKGAAVSFEGRLRFYVDTASVPVPDGTDAPPVYAYFLFDSKERPGVRDERVLLFDRNTIYRSAGDPLDLLLDPEFDFSIREEGLLRISAGIWPEDGSYAAGESLPGDFYDEISIEPEK